MTSPANRVAGTPPGAQVTLKPGLRNRHWQSRNGTVVEILNDKLKVRLDRLDYWCDRSEIQA
jgi:hypothetical protein